VALAQYKNESTSGTVSITNTQTSKDLLGGATAIALSGGVINLTATGLECTTSAAGQFTLVRYPFLAPNDVVAISERFTYTVTPTATIGVLQLMSTDNSYTVQLRVSTANAPAPRDNGTGGTALTLSSGTVPSLVPGTDYVGKWLVSRTAGTVTFKLYDATEATLYATWTKSSAVLGTTQFAAVEVGNILGATVNTIRTRRLQLNDGATTDIPVWVDPVSEVQGTVIGTLSTTHRSDGVDVATSADKGGWSIAQNGAGNTWTFLDAARHGGISGQRIVQAGSGGPVSNGYVDFTNTNPVFGLRWHINFAQTPIAPGTFVRTYADSTHSTPSLSLSRGTDGKVSVIEGGSTVLGTTSAALPNTTDLILMLLQNGSTGAVVFRVYARGTAALLIPELDVTMASPFTVQSVRGGIGNLNSLVQIDLNDMCAWGAGGWMPRPDLATLTLSPPPAADGSVVSTATVTATVTFGETGAESVWIVQNSTTTIAGPQAGGTFTLTPPLTGTISASVQPAT
jgi:hypothetical protein